MTRALKVFGGNYDGQHRLIMATTSKTRFCLLTGCKGSHTSETANVIEVPLAMASPEIPFLKKYSPHNAPYVRAALANAPGKNRVMRLPDQAPRAASSPSADSGIRRGCAKPSRSKTRPDRA